MERSYTIRVGVDATGVGTGLSQARGQVAGFGRQVQSEFAKAQEATNQVGTAMLAVGAATVAGLALSAREAVNWESAWAGVTKTIEGTPAQLSGIEDGLRGMARELPSSHQQIAAVAEAAGQLGVETPAVLNFTRTMIDLGETTDLTAEGAATSIAQIANVMGTDLQNEVDNFGATLVELGNNGASTESQILEMAQRIAGAGSTIGLAETEVLAFASTLSSVGIRAEAGGSAISKVFVDIASAAANGGAQLEGFAQVAGQSASDFATSFEEDPARAMQSFVEGLARIDEEGGNVFAVLEDLGLSEIRTRDALLRLANAGGLLGEQLDLASIAWAENNALAEEAGKRYDTTAAQISIAKNNIVDAAISLGETMLPAIETVVGGIADLAGWFAELPEPVLGVVSALAGIAGVASLAGGAFLLLFPRVMQTVTAFRSLNTIAPGIAGVLRRIGRAATIASAVSLVASAIGQLANSGESGARGVEATTRALIELQQAADNGQNTVQVLDSLFTELDNQLLIGGDGVNSFGDALDRIFDPSNLQRYNDFSNAALNAITLGGWGQGESTELQNAEEQISNMDKAMANMVESGYADKAAASWEEMVAAAEKQGVSVDQLRKVFPLYQEALQGIENDNKLAAESGEQTNAMLEDQAAAVGLTVEEYQLAETQVKESVKAMAESLASAVDPVAAWDTAQQRAAESAAEAAGEGKEAWADFADSVSASFDEYIAELEKQVKAQQDWATNIGIIAQEVGPDIAEEIMNWGPEAAPLVQEFVDNIGTEEFGKLEPLLRQSMESNATAISEEMRRWFQIAGPIADEFGKETADRIARGLATGQTSLDQALAELNLKLVENIPGEFTVETDMDASDFFIKADSVSKDITRLNKGKALPVADLNIKQFRGQEGIVRQHLKDLDAQRPTPKANLNKKALELSKDESNRYLDRLDRRRPTPRANLDNRPLDQNVDESNRYISRLHKRRPTPVANLNDRPLQVNADNAQKRVNSLHGKTVTARARTEGTSGVSGLFGWINALYSKTVTVTAVTKRIGGPLPKANGGPITGYASGGGIDLRAGGHNPYGTTSTADDVLALVSKDEFVVRAAYAKKHRKLLEDINSGIIPRYQDGGPVGINTGRAQFIAAGPVPPTPRSAIDFAAAGSGGGLSEADRQLLLAAIERPIELQTVDRTVIAKEAESGQAILARRR